MDQIASLTDYLTTLPPAKLGRLYDSPFTCMAVLKSLAPLARQYVLRLLFVDAGAPAALAASWPRLGDAAAGAAHEAALEKLGRLQLVRRRGGGAGGGDEVVLLDAAFQAQLRGVVCSGLGALVPAPPPEVAAAAPGAAELDAFAEGQWEALLLFLVGSAPAPPAPPRGLPRGCAPLDVAGLLRRAGLAAPAADGGGVSAAGFHFLLLDTYSQLWALLREYVSAAEAASGAELASAVGFLLQLGQQGRRPLRWAALPPAARAIAAHTAQLGLLAPFSAGGEAWLAPTRLAAIMAGGPGGAGGAGGGAAAAGAACGSLDDGYVIVETNFRVYAYTSSPVRQAVLRLFVRCEVLLPNLFVGSITRDAVVSALDAGITAEQIIGYLRSHAHARAARPGAPAVPPVVADQVRLWGAELRRLGARRAVLYRAFESGFLYAAARRAAERRGALLHADDAAGRLVVAAEAHEGMRGEIRAAKAELGLA